MGPIHDRLAGAAAAAAVAPAAAGAAAGVGAVCCGAACFGGGVWGAGWAGALRCMPWDLPLPRRLASESIGVEVASATTRAPSSQFFMSFLSMELRLWAWTTHAYSI